eukprot:423618-Pyramimonas_sp.AAC.1
MLEKPFVRGGSCVCGQLLCLRRVRAIGRRQACMTPPGDWSPSASLRASSSPLRRMRIFWI